jgi:hypothetical protein
MKKCCLFTCIVGLVCACLILIGCETTQSGAASAPPPNSGRLVVDRVANFGTGLVLVLSIDGKDVATLTEGRHYDGYLSAGQHHLTARVDPFQAGTQPTRKTLTIKAGQTYSYTASWSGQNLVFVKNS